MDWPLLTIDHTLRRLAAPTHEVPSFGAEYGQLVAEFELQQESVGETFEEMTSFGLGYPWPQDVRDVVIEGDEVRPGHDLDDGIPRFPLLAYGANAVPHQLLKKFVGLEPQAIRIRPARLEDFDVVAGLVLTPYGAVPAELAPSPGTSVRVAVVWATEPQIERLTFTEFGYQFGLIEEAKLTIEGQPGPTEVFAYASRFGGFGIDGELVALSAVEADNRNFRAMSQIELIDEFATRILGDDADADALLRNLHTNRDDYMAFMLKNAQVILRDACQIEPYPTFVEYSSR